MLNVLFESEERVKLPKCERIADGDRLITYRDVAAIAQLSDHGFDLLES
jgi:hypothetical protein